MRYSNTMTDQKEHFLPKEPVDLPREPKELPPSVGTSAGKPAHADSPQGLHEVKTLLSWHAPGRPFQKRSVQFYINSFIIAVLLGIIAILFQQVALILVIFSLLFVVFALNTVAPHDFRYRISTEGITIEDHFFLWIELYDFYFKRRSGHDILHVRTKAFIPGELTLTLGDMHKEHVKSVLLPYLPYREVVQPTFMEKSGDWLSRTFPLEKRHA